MTSDFAAQASALVEKLIGTGVAIGEREESWQAKIIAALEEGWRCKALYLNAMLPAWGEEEKPLAAQPPEAHPNVSSKEG